MMAGARSRFGRDVRRGRLLVWGGCAALMLLPAIGMQLSREVAWGPADFILFGAMLGGVGLGYELAARASDRRAYLAAVLLALAGAFLLVFINLAVGMIGAEDNPANLLYLAVPATGGLGAILARFRPLGMARAMVATAIAQALVFLTVWVAGLGFTGAVTIFFMLLWLGAAWLFRRAAR